MLLPALLYTLINGMHSLASVASLFEPTARAPPAKATVAVCCYREPRELLELSLGSLTSQDIVRLYPEMFELLVVTSGGCDEGTALRLGFSVVRAPRGKLMSRDIATRLASGEIIVSADADTFYPPGWLSRVLEPFRDPAVVGVAVPSIEGGAPLRELFFGLWKHIVYRGKVLGRGSAYRKWAYLAAGGFNTEADRLYLETGDIHVLVYEEEVGFKERLERVGRVIYVNAPVIHMGPPSSRGLHA
jgi:cellulose synthase/poly-beta-1,6-N-acetylglucosamine synthase-like glycosyltransferase